MKKQLPQPTLPVQQQLLTQVLPKQTEPIKLKDYLQYFGVQLLSQVQSVKQSTLSLLPPQIQYDNQLEFAKKIILKITKYSHNYEFVDFQARLGYFTFHRISVVNINHVSTTHQVEDNDSGNFCTVYRCQCKGNSLAFKCFLKQKLALQQESLLGKVMEQFCVLKLASYLRAGPKVYDILGYDIIIYPECIQFSMQSCQPSNSQYFLKRKEQAFQDLKQNLLKLHSINIIHHDIKVENICFSKEYDKFVFIDFGMGTIIQSNIGFKTYTVFRGSLQFCSEQMAQLFNNASYMGKQIDLYYNDYIGLKTTLTLIPTNLVNYSPTRYQPYFQEYGPDPFLIRQQRYKFMKQKQLEQFQYLTFIKYSLFQQKQVCLQALIQRLSKEQILQLFYFITNLPFSQKKKIISTDLLKIIKNRQYSLSFQQSYSSQQYIRTQVNCCNKDYPVQYFLNQFSTNFNEILQLFKNKNAKIVFKVEEYLCLLSKAIQMNATQLKIQQLDLISRIAIINFKQMSIIKQDLDKYNDKQAKYFLRVSQFLFKLAFQHQLKENYFRIFIFIINNVVMYQLITKQEILQYYKLLLEIKLSFQKKMLCLLKFSIVLKWVHIFTTPSLQKTCLLDQIGQLSQKFISKNTLYDEKQMIILKAILRQKEANKLPSQIEINSRQLKYQLKAWIVVKSLTNLNLSTPKYLLYNELNEYLAYLSLYSTTNFQLNHFYLLIQYFERKKQAKFEYLLIKCEKTLRNKQNNSFLILLKAILFLWKSHYKQIEKFLSMIEKINYDSNIFSRLIIQKQFAEIIGKQAITFKMCRVDTKQKLFTLWKDVLLLKQKQQPLLKSIQKLINNTFKEFLVSNYYFNYFERHTTSLENIHQQQYSHLIRRIRQRNIIDNFLIFNCNIFVLIQLTKNKRFSQALQLGKYLNRLIYLFKQRINKHVIFQFMFCYLIPQIQKTNKSIKDQNKQLYFQYAKIIAQQKIEQSYLLRARTFIDIIGLFYKYRPCEVLPLMNRMSDILVVTQDKWNAEKYYNMIEVLFYKNRQRQYFVRKNKQLYQQLQLETYPYNLIVFFSIYILKRQKQVQKKDFVRIFSSIKNLTINIRQYILRTTLYFFLAFYKNVITTKKRIVLVKKLVQYKLCFISLKKIVILLINERSLSLLKKPFNLKKLQHIKNLLNKYNECILEPENNQFINVLVQYSKLVIVRT